MKMIGPFIYTAGFSEKEMEIPDATTAEGLLAMVSLEKSRPKIVTCNGKAISMSEAVKDGDRIVIAPIYSGG